MVVVATTFGFTDSFEDPGCEAQAAKTNAKNKIDKILNKDRCFITIVPNFKFTGSFNIDNRYQY